MYDKGLAGYIVKQILQSSMTISLRFESVNTVDDFTNTPRGMEKFDSICNIIISGCKLAGAGIIFAIPSTLKVRATVPAFCVVICCC